MDRKREIIMALKLIAAKAEKLGYDLENNKLWDGELERGLVEIQKSLSGALSDATNQSR